MAAKFTPGTSSNPTSEVELTISCRNLLDCDVFSKSDPMCVIFLKTPEMQTWREIFRTECISNDLNPHFAKKPVLVYQFEIQQQLRFNVYDIDNESADLSNHDFLGSTETTLGQIVSTGTLSLPLHGGSNYNKGEIILKAEELSQNHDEVLLQFGATGLHRNDWVGWMCSFVRSVNTFLEFAKVSEDGEYSLVHRTPVQRWTSNPQWKTFIIPLRALCGGDMDRDIRIRCYDHHWGGGHTLLGEFHTNLNQLSKFTTDPNISFQLTNSEKRRRSSHQGFEGTVTLLKFEIRNVYTFLDYIMNGTQINCTFAIDFTSSNGDPSNSDSLHYISNNNYFNQYEQALRAVGDIIQDYDSDKMYPVLGFGARLPPDGRVSHEFYVNLDPSNPYCEGIDGVLSAYKNCVQTIRLCGPTNFAPIINHVMQFAKVYAYTSDHYFILLIITDGIITDMDQTIKLYGPTNFSPVINHVANFAKAYAHSHEQYFILLIITDGIITDMQLTKKAIVDASMLPMSIIIVGVGNADFSAMDELDADTVPLQYNGKFAARDIVQFVPFRDFQNLQNVELARTYLAKEVLAEIPTQLVEYMKASNIKPGQKTIAH